LVVLAGVVVAAKEETPMNSENLNPFNCPQRDQLFNHAMRMKWYDICPIDGETGLPLVQQKVPYALYHCYSVSPDMVQEIKQASEAVGRVLMETWSVLRTLEEEALHYYGFPQETIKLVKSDSLPPFCMRLDWCWNEQTGIKKVIETNAQTPSFWFECTQGNRQVAAEFGLEDPDCESDRILTVTLGQHLKRAAADLNKPLSNCRIAFTALNNPEDMGTMKWLSRHVQGRSLVFPLEYLRIQDGEYLFYQRTGEPIDILFMWYPMEWAIYDTDEGDRPLWPALEELILQKRVILVNFASAFALQPKSVFALIQDLGIDFFEPQIAATVFDYFPKTSLTPKTIGNSYFGKPILGRQGEGAFAFESGEVISESDNNDPWYTEQEYVYQELLSFPQLEIMGEPMNVLWGVWLYNNGQDQLISGGLGIRVSEGPITDDLSYWCPIGLSFNNR